MRHTFASAFGFTTALLTGLSVFAVGVLAAKNLDDEQKIARLEKELRDLNAWNDRLVANLAK